MNMTKNAQPAADHGARHAPAARRSKLSRRITGSTTDAEHESGHAEHQEADAGGRQAQPVLVGALHARRLRQ